jgi:hypothetical protein
MTLDELKHTSRKYRIGIAEWADTRDSGLDTLIRDAKTRDGDVAIEILEGVPSNAFTEAQLSELFEALTFWIQGPSKLYSLAVRVITKHSRVLITRLESSFRDASRRGDDSLVRALCHIFSRLDIDLKMSVKKSVADAFALSNAEVREAIHDLIESSSVFDLPGVNCTGQ